MPKPQLQASELDRRNCRRIRVVTKVFLPVSFWKTEGTGLSRPAKVRQARFSCAAFWRAWEARTDRTGLVSGRGADSRSLIRLSVSTSVTHSIPCSFLLYALACRAVRSTGKRVHWSIQKGLNLAQPIRRGWWWRWEVVPAFDAPRQILLSL